MMRAARIVLGILFAAMLVEAAVALVRRRPYDLADAAANVALYAGYLGILVLWTPWLFLLYAAVHEHAVFELGGPGSWALLVVCEDLCFYAFHRASHRCRLLWASHEPHHSSRQFNWSVALRQTWTPFLAAPFWLPLPLLGFDPLRVLTVQTGSLAFQAFLHTELVASLGPLEWIFNTPRHHRVHHGATAACVDKNFGGVFIFWDRLFGTFARADGELAYGTGDAARGRNPLRIAFHEWRALVRDLGRSRSLAGAVRALLGPPGAAERIDG